MSYESDTFLTSREAWGLLKICRANFWAKVRKGELPPATISIGKLRRWSRQQLLASVVTKESISNLHSNFIKKI